MTVSDLRVLVSNLDEYIHIPGGIERLKKTVLHLAVSGQLVAQDPSEGTGEDLFKQIQAIHKPKKPLPEITENEIPFSVPKTWKWVRFGTLGQFGSGSTPMRGENKYYDGDINWFKSGELTDGYMSQNSEETVTETALKECSLRMNHKGDILIAMYGATAGKLGLLEVDGTTNQAVCGVTVYEQVYRLFAYYWLLGTRDDLIAQSSGAAQPNISKIKIVNHYFALPPIAEQKRIVEKIEHTFTLIDELASTYKAEEAERSKFVRSSLRALSHNKSTLALDNLTQTIKTKADAAKLRKAILHLAVSGQLVPQIPSEGTGEELYKQIQSEKAKLPKKQRALPEVDKDEIPFGIPGSWRWTRVSDLGYALGQKVPDKDFYYIDVASIDNSSQTLKQPSVVTAKDAPSRARKIVTRGTVIYSTVRPYLLNTTVIQDGFDKELIASTAFAILHPFEGVDSHWLLFNLISQYFIDYTNEKSVGAAYPAINDAQFSMAIMPLPPLAEQKRIVHKTTELLDLVTELEKHLEQ